jgi:hypothetical protein
LALVNIKKQFPEENPGYEPFGQIGKKIYRSGQQGTLPLSEENI